MPGRHSSKTGYAYYWLTSSLLCVLSSLAYSELEFSKDSAINDSFTATQNSAQINSDENSPAPTNTAQPPTDTSGSLEDSDKKSVGKSTVEKTKTKTKKRLSENAQQQLNAMEQRLEQLQIEQGNFSGASSEVLLEMAQLYQQHAHYKEAGELLGQAMQVQKINLGLYSPQQMPIAKLLVDNLIAQGKWHKALDKQEFRRWLANRYLQETPAEHMAMLLDLAQWQLHAYVFTGRRDDNHIVAAKRIYHQYIHVYGKNMKQYQNTADLTKALQGFIASNYFLLKSKEQDTPSGFSVSAGRDSPFAQQQQEFDTLRSSTFASGKKALLGMVHETNSPQEKLKQLVLSGDWHLLFGKTNSAKQLYRQAFDYATQEKLDLLFDKPVAIPELPQWQNNFTTNVERRHVMATFDIGRDGRARNVRVDQNDIKLRGKIKRQLRKTHFRPVLDENGRFSNSRDVQQSFSFP